MTTVNELEMQRRQVLETAAMLDALEKLERNPSYKKLFIEGYFKDFAVNQTLALSNPALQSDADQKKILRSLEGIGQLHVYLRHIAIEGHTARAMLPEIDQAIEEVIAEGEEE